MSLFLKHKFFELFFTLGVLPGNSIFLVVVQICMILVVDETFFPLCNRYHEKGQSVLNTETNSFNIFMHLINPNYAWKNWVKQIKTTQYKLLQWCFFYPLLRTQTTGQNAGKFSFFNFWYHLSYTWVDLICLACLTFPKSLWWTACRFWA